MQLRHLCTMVQNRNKNSIQSFTFLRAREWVSERVSEWVSAAEKISNWTNKWPSTSAGFLVILDHSRLVPFVKVKLSEKMIFHSAKIQRKGQITLTTFQLLEISSSSGCSSTFCFVFLSVSLSPLKNMADFTKKRRKKKRTKTTNNTSILFFLYQNLSDEYRVWNYWIVITEYWILRWILCGWETNGGNLLKEESSILWFYTLKVETKFGTS